VRILSRSLIQKLSVKEEKKLEDEEKSKPEEKKEDVD